MPRSARGGVGGAGVGQQLWAARREDDTTEGGGGVAARIGEATGSW